MSSTYNKILTMEMFVVTLEPFHLLTDAMSAEKSVSVSQLWSLLNHIKNVCGSDIPGNNFAEELKKMSSTLRKSIWKYIDERHGCLCFILVCVMIKISPYILTFVLLL